MSRRVNLELEDAYSELNLAHAEALDQLDAAKTELRAARKVIERVRQAKVERDRLKHRPSYDARDFEALAEYEKVLLELNGNKSSDGSV